MSWDDISLVLGSPLCKKILECLSNNKPLAPLQIAKFCSIARSNVSTKLSILNERGLVEAVNPDARKWRFYRITKKGLRVLKEIEGIKK